MAWSIGSDVTAGSVLTASRYNQDVIANLTELAPFQSAWVSYTPELRQATTARTSTNIDSKYLKIGKSVWVNACVQCTQNGTASDTINLSLPSGIVPASGGINQIIGTFTFNDNGTYYNAPARIAYAGYIGGIANASASYIGFANPAATLAATQDFVAFSVQFFTA